MFTFRLILLFCLLIVDLSLAVPSPDRSHLMSKRVTFSSLGCLGEYNEEKFNRLNSICEECYYLYRDESLLTACRDFCFRNKVFPGCADALLMQKEKKELDEIVAELLG